MVTPTFLPYLGGQEIYVQKLSEALVERGHEVTIFTTDAISRVPIRRVVSEHREEDGLTVLRFPCYGFLYSYLPISPGLIIRLLKKQMTQQHIVHAHGFGHFTSDIVAIMRRIFKTPAVLTTHGLHQESGQEGFLRRLLWLYYRESFVRLTLRTINRIVVLSPDETRYFVRFGPGVVSKVRVIPIGVAPEEFQRPDAMAEPTRPLILYVGRIDRGKGLEFLVEAASRLKRYNPLVVLAGARTGFSKTLEELAARKNVAQSIVLTGAVSETTKRRLLTQATVFCLPSKYEGASLAVLEAMAAGKPVVAANVGGVPFLVDDSSSGYLVRYRDTDALTERLEKLITNPNARSAMGEAGRAIAERHSWSRVAEKTEQLYLELVGSAADIEQSIHDSQVR